MTNAELVDERFYKRWASIYHRKGQKEGWPAAKDWVRRTFDPPITEKLRPHIERLFGLRS